MARSSGVLGCVIQREHLDLRSPIRFDVAEAHQGPYGLPGLRGKLELSDQDERPSYGA